MLVPCIDVNVYLWHHSGFEAEAMAWFDFWSSLQMQHTNSHLRDILSHTEFYFAIHEAIVLLLILTLPATTCAFER